MKLRKCSMGIALAISPIIFSGTVSAAGTHWWDDYRNHSGFVEALPHIGYSLNELQNNSAQGLKDSADSRTPLYWLKRTMDMYPPATPDRYNMPVAHHETKDWPNGLYTTMGRGILFFTRTMGEAGQRVTINTGDIPAGASCYAATGRDFVKSDHSFLDQQKLTAGSDNHYTFKQRGVLMLGCGDPDKQQNGAFVPLTVKGGQNNNLFILGQSTQRDWQASKATTSDFGFALLYDGHANTVVPNKKAQSTNEIIGKVLGDNLRTIALYEKINGMDGSEVIFKSSQGSMFINYEECCYAAYRNGFVGVGFHSDRMNAKNGDDWGIWHELGHQYEPFKEYQALFPEIQVNRYTMEACTMLSQGRDINCHTTEGGNWDPRAVENFLASGERYQDYSAIDDYEKQLAFFTRLRFSYGENFFPKVNQTRLKTIHGAPGNSQADKVSHVIGSKQKVIDFSVVAYSQAAGQDLREYFTRLGMAYSPAAGQKVAEMNLPQPGEEEGSDLMADAGKDQQRIQGSAKQSVPLDGSASKDAQSYLWEIVSGDFALNNPKKARAQAVIPANATGETVYRLTVTDKNGKQHADTVTVKAVKTSVAIEGVNTSVVGTPLKLTASANFKGNAGQPLKFQWTVEDYKGRQVQQGKNKTLNVNNNGKLTAGIYAVSVTVSSDLMGRTATAEHSVTLTDETVVVDKDQQMLDSLPLLFIEQNYDARMSYNAMVVAGDKQPAPAKVSYQWKLPSKASQVPTGMVVFDMVKTNKAQTVSLEVTLTAGKATRVLTQSMTVPAKSGGDDNNGGGNNGGGNNSHPAYKEGTSYNGGDIVKGRDDNAYQCKPFPYSGWCGQVIWAYEPGFGAHWTDAWTRYTK